MSKVLILGAGPAGISAALYTVRAGIETTVIHKGGAGSALDKAHSIENYYGFAEPISGKELYENGIAGAKRLGVQFVEDEAVALEWNGSFAVETLQGRYEADAVIIALGAERADPRIPGTKEFEGRGVSWCAVCDAFFFRGKDVLVAGGGNVAVEDAIFLARGCNKVYVVHIDSYSGEGSSIDAFKVFATREQAREHLKKCRDDFEGEDLDYYDPEDYIIEDDEDSYTWYIDGQYDQDHYCISIHELEVE